MRRLLSWIGLLSFWALLAALVQHRYLPAPWAVAQTLYSETLDGELLFHLRMTLQRVFVAFSLAMLIGVATGFAMGRDKKVNEWFDGLLVLFLNIPALVITLLCYIWLGLGEFAAVLAVALNKIPTVTVILREGSRALDPALDEMACAFRLSWTRKLRYIWLPQLTPYLLSAARNGLSLIWKIVLVVELLGRSNGFGFQFSMFFHFFDITSILAYTFAFIVVIIVIEHYLLRPLERHLNAWRTAS